MTGHRGARIPFIFGLTRGILSGVDVFVTRLVRWLVSEGEDARILFTWPEVEPPADVRFDVLETSDDWDWHRRWGALREYLAANAPCVFVANYDTEHSVGLLPPLDGVGIVLTVQSDDPQHYGHVLMIGSEAARIVAVSAAIADHIALIAPLLRSRTVVIPNGVDLPIAPPRERDAVARPLDAVYAGRITVKQKNVPELVRAAARIDAIGSLTLIGEGSAEASALLWGMIRGFNLRHIPTLPHASLAEQYAMHDVALLHSTYEGLPLMILEAMSHGCIPVCRLVRSGLPELIDHGTNGFFYETVEELAGICRILSADGAMRRRVAASAYETIVAREHSESRPYARYAALLNEVASEVAASNFSPR